MLDTEGARHEQGLKCSLSSLSASPFAISGSHVFRFDHRVGRLWALSMMSESSYGLDASEPHRLCYPYSVPWVCHTTAQGKVVSHL